MTDPALGHNRDGYGFLNAADHLRIAHAGNAAGCTDVGRNPFECHDGACAGFFCNFCLFWCGDVHNYATF